MFKYYFFLDWKKTKKVWRTEDGHSEIESGAKLFDTKSQAELDFFSLLIDNEELRKGEFIDITKGKKKEKPVSVNLVWQKSTNCYSGIFDVHGPIS